MNWLRNSRFYADGMPAVGLLLLRIFIGYAMAMHSLPKLSSPFHWMDQMPNHPPGFLQALGAGGEFLGGIALLFGILTPLAALWVMSTMFVATLAVISMGSGPHYFVAPPGAEPKSSYESSAMYFIFALTLFLTGPGLLSVDAFLFGRKRAVPVAAAPVSTPPATPPAVKTG